MMYWKTNLRIPESITLQMLDLLKIQRYRGKSTIFTCLMFCFFVGSNGCASFTNPIADGIPVRRLPDELKGISRENLKSIPFNLLRQKKPDYHLVDAGDILGIVIEGVLSDRGTIPIQPPAVGPGPISTALGTPIQVQDGGKLILPYIEPLDVKGLTLEEVRAKIVDAYTKKKKILKDGNERILVSLIQPRKYNVLVIREDTGTTNYAIGPSFGNAGAIVGSNKKGTGFSLDLPIYENDVFSALAKSGGLPGTDAKNEVTIYRKNTRKRDGKTLPDILTIPLKLQPGQDIPFQPEDVILDNGDIVYIQSRDAEFFFTGGLLGAGQYLLPRDYDLNVIQAVNYVRGPLVNGGFGQAFFIATVVNTGLGNPSPSLINVLRKTPNGQQVNIRVDLNLALRDPRERILIQPGDYIILQERPEESFGRYFSTIFKYNLLWTIVNKPDFNATNNLAGP